MAFKLRSRYGYVLTEVVSGLNISLPASSVQGAGVVSSGALTLSANLVSLASASLSGTGAVTAGALTTTINLISLTGISVAGAGAVSAGSLTKTLWLPTALGTTKLRLWTRPESQAWTTSARSTPETGTGVVGSKDDESGNSFHLIQATAGTRPTRKTNGGFRCNGTALYTNSALGAWTGDFDVYVVIKQNTVNSNYRVMEVDYASGFGILQSGPDRVKLAIAAPSSPYGFDAASALTTIHVVHCWRVGTTASISIDGAAPATATVTGAALANTALYVGLSNAGSFGGDVDHHEIVVAKDITAPERAQLDAYFAERKASGVYV